VPAQPARSPLWISGAALAFITVLAFVVRANNAVTRADADVISWMTDWRSPLLVDLAHGASLLGNILVLGPLAIVAAVASLAASKRQHEHGGPRPPRSSGLAFLPALALAAAALTNPLFKLAVGRPRPPAELAEAIESSSGFPSGHSAQSLAFWVALAILIAARSDHPRRWLAAGIAVAFVVGLSRVVLGVHSPTDLLGGWALGLACLLLSALALRAHPRNDEGPADARP
jgi:undecaprenyl-diphosphatase